MRDSNAIRISLATSATDRPKADERPKKPDVEGGFPLYAHPLGYWSKKINNKITHFGRWGRVVKGKLQKLPYEPSWKEALASYRKHESDARAGKLEGVVILKDDARPLSFSVWARCPRRIKRL